MASLIYNGKEITIEDKRVSVTALYGAQGKPPNKAPTNFKTSKKGKEKINEYERKYGRWVWDSRTGISTIAIIDLAVEYLEYLGDPKAATKLWEVYETGQDIEYNTQNNTQNMEYNTQTANQSEDNPSKENTSLGCGGIILLIIMFILFASFNSNKDLYKQHQDDPPAQPYNYPSQ